MHDGTWYQYYSVSPNVYNSVGFSVPVYEDGLLLYSTVDRDLLDVASSPSIASRDTRWSNCTKKHSRIGPE